MEDITTSAAATDEHAESAVRSWPEPAAERVPLGRADAARQLAADTGRSVQTAEAMIRDYLDDTSARLGFPVHRWGLDTSDLAEIRRGYEWIDYERGETGADAARIATGELARWQQRALADEQEPFPFTGRTDHALRLWGDRASFHTDPAAERDSLAHAQEAVAAATAATAAGLHHDDAAEIDTPQPSDHTLDRDSDSDSAGDGDGGWPA